jgi:hypothetical protein
MFYSFQIACLGGACFGGALLIAAVIAQSSVGAK